VNGMATTEDTAARETWVTEDGEVVEVATTRPRRRRTGTTILLAIVLVLVAIAVVGDRLAAKFATDQLRTRLVAAVDDHGIGYRTIDVNIGGFPFLTQVAKGKYDDITIDMTDVRLKTATGRTAEMPTLHAVASGVNADTADVVRGNANVVADKVDGTALVSFATLQSAVDYSQYDLSNVIFTEADGGLKATANANVAGTSIPLTATADVRASGGALQITLRDATAVGFTAPQVVKTFLARLASTQIAAHLPVLPFGLTLNKVTVQSDGLAVNATGINVPLTR